MKYFHFLKYFQDSPGVGGVLPSTLPVLHPVVDEGVGAVVLVVVPPAAVGPGQVGLVVTDAGGTPGYRQDMGESDMWEDALGRFQKYLLCKLVDF